MNQSPLEKIQTISSIVSAVAIPLVIAIVGWWVQSSLQSEDIKKDYVQMALGILQSSEQQENDDLRRWAVAILDKNSPIEIPIALKEKLSSGEIGIRFFPSPPGSLMQPPEKLEQIEQAGPVSSADALQIVTQNYAICHRNAIKLEFLQLWAKEMRSVSIGERIE